MYYDETKSIFKNKIKVFGETGQRFEQEFLDNFESKHTRVAYKKDITQFFAFLTANFNSQVHPLNVEKLHIVQFKKMLSTIGGRKNKPAAPKTINRKLAAISAFYSFLIEKSYLQSNPASHIQRPKDTVQKETCDLSDEQVRTLFKTMDSIKSIPMLHKAILSVFLACGIRKSEIINLKRIDYQEEKGIKFLRIFGKGGKYNRVPLHPYAISRLEEYLDCRDLADEDYLFSDHKERSNKPLCPSSIDYIVKRYIKIANIEEQITAHSLRATVIGSLLEAEVDIYKVAQLVNHESVKTTQSYDKRRRQLSESAAFKIKYF